MDFQLVVLSAEGIKKLSRAIEDRGGSLEEIFKKTGISPSVIKNLVEKTPFQESTVKTILSALSIDFDDSLTVEAVEAPIKETRRRLEQRRKERENRERALRFLRSAGQETSDRERALQNQIIVDNATEELSETPVDDVQGIASTQLRILDRYYSEGLTQAKTSFRSALVISGFGFCFLLTAVIFVLRSQSGDQTLIPLIAGAIIEVVAGINFHLYDQATKQLAAFQNKLNQMQRFLVANSICESLEGEIKHTTRAKLVETVSSLVE